MIVTTKRIEYKYGQTFKLKPIADVHIGARACDLSAFKDYMEDSDDNTYFIGIGDLYDAIVVQDFRYQKSSDRTKGDAVIDEQVEEGVEILEPYKDKILGLGLGNHERTVIKRCGTNMIDSTCKVLGIPSIGYSGLFRLMFSENGARTRTVIIRYHHGWGGGSRTIGADLTKFSRDVAYWDADIFLYGHVHRKQSDEIPRLGLRGEKLYAKPKVIAICGTFLRTYMDTNDATYSEVCGYPPTAIGGITLSLKPDGKWMDIKVQ
jgi:hypothetical protein